MLLYVMSCMLHAIELCVCELIYVILDDELFV
jgi:hypothetical protein